MWWHFGNLRAELNHCICVPQLRWSLNITVEPSILHRRILLLFPVAGSRAWEWPFITIRFLSPTSARKRARVDQMLSLSSDILNNKPLIACFFSTHYALQTYPTPRQKTLTHLWEILSLKTEGSSIGGAGVIWLSDDAFQVAIKG